MGRGSEGMHDLSRITYLLFDILIPTGFVLLALTSATVSLSSLAFTDLSSATPGRSHVLTLPVALSLRSDSIA